MVKKALTMLELIFVIVILGLLVAGGSKIFLQVYNNYNTTKKITELESQSAAVLDIVSAKLSKRIHQSLRYRCEITSRASDVKYLKDVKVGDNFCSGNQPAVLEWVANFNNNILINNTGTLTPKPCYSGVVNMRQTLDEYAKRVTFNTINIYDVKQDNMVNSICFSNGEEVGVYFLDTLAGADFIENIVLDAKVLKDGGTNNGFLQIQKGDYEQINISSAYAIAKTAFAISLEDVKEMQADTTDENSKVKFYNMYLYYDYKPWKASQKNQSLSALFNNKSNNKPEPLVKKTLLAENVTQFRTILYQEGVGMDICVDDPHYIVTNKEGKKRFLRVCKTGGAI